MTLTEFDNGYWYAADLKQFATTLGIALTGKLRKDELELAIRQYLKKGVVAESPARLKRSPKKNTSGDTVPDFELGLRLDLRVVNYTSNKITKTFIVNSAKAAVSSLKERSGVRYRLNRWRDEQLDAGKKLTYGDLVKQYIALNQSSEPFKRVPTGRYINFLADYSAQEKNGSRAHALQAWHTLKKLDIPKTYAAWKRHKKVSL